MMKLFAATLAVLSLAASAQAEQRKPAPQRAAPPIVHEITPALGPIPMTFFLEMSGSALNLLPEIAAS